ncbi:MAG: enoyl-CoA hydratase [SAR324 cluster bacterium]|nr:enoyl-CoA hydratase [SAR324 cluster bacterium]MCZ6841487.1 enoyl-CoA hydratase [SAR324 cluster bacterium]
MSYEYIELEQDGPLAILRFSRPDQYNALNPQMASELVDAMVEIKNNPAYRALMVTGKGNAFHSGGDIKWFVESEQALTQKLERVITDLHAFISRLIRLPKPVVAAVNGPAAGAGFSLAMACDLVVARADAVFTLGYTKIGASPDGGSTFYLPRLVGLRRALELAYTNRVLTAEQAMQWGLVNRVFPEENFMEEAKKFAMELANGATAALGRTKDLLYHSLNHELETQLELEARGIIDSVSTEDFAEGTRAFVEKRKARFKGG